MTTEPLDLDSLEDRLKDGGLSLGYDEVRNELLPALITAARQRDKLLEAAKPFLQILEFERACGSVELAENAGAVFLPISLRFCKRDEERREFNIEIGDLETLEFAIKSCEAE